MSLLQRASRGYLWSQVGRFVEVVCLFALSVILARHMSLVEYGVFALGLSLVTFCGFLTAMGVGQEALSKFVPEAAEGLYSGGVRRLVGQLLGVRVAAVAALSGVVMLAGGRIDRFLGVPGLRQCLGWILLLFALRSICELFSHVFSGLLELRVVAAGRAIVPLAALALVAGSLWQGRKLSSADAFLALAVGQFIGLLIFVRSARKGWPVAPGSSAAGGIHLRRVLSFGLYAWLAGFFVYVLGDSSDVILISWLSKDAKAVGLYAVGSSAVFRVLSLSLAWVPLIAMPTQCLAYLDGGKQHLAEAAEAVWKLIVISLVPAMFLLSEFSLPIVTLIYSKEYQAAAPVLRVLAVLLAMSAVLGNGVHAGILYLLNQEKKACAIFAGAAAFNVALAILLIRALGIIGAAWATGLSFVFFSALCAFFGNAVCPVRWPRAFVSRVVLASALSCLATSWLKVNSLQALAMAGAAWGLIFWLGLALIKPLSAKDSSSLRRINAGLAYVAERFFVRSS